MSRLDEIQAGIAELQQEEALIKSYVPGEKWERYSPGVEVWFECEGEPIWGFRHGMLYRKKQDPECVYIIKHEDGGIRCFRSYDSAVLKLRTHSSGPFKFIRAPE